MPQENIEAFKRAVEALNRRDLDATLTHYDPAVEWYPGPQAVLAGGATVYRGHDGIRRLFDDFDGVFAESEFEFWDYRDLGDRLLAIGEFRARGRASGVETVSPVAYIVDGKDGRAIRVHALPRPRPGTCSAGLA